ncbi:MAG TPA: phage holin family protein [Bradyrhizobium sp.]
MLALWSGLLRTGLALKIRQIKLATRSYLRDRAAQGQGIVASYAVAAGLYAAAGIFLIAACLVGVTALFRWIEMNYGLFQAFGAVGGLLLIVAIVFAALAASKVKRPAPHFPSLTSRLRAAIKANPVNPDQIEAVRDTAAAILIEPSAPVASVRRSRRDGRRPAQEPPDGRAALIVIAILLGWAVARRHSNARKSSV